MSEYRLHIIAFNNPYPPDYGGVIDIYHKLKALSEAGVMITLHCFLYGRQTSKELEELCFMVHYYPRKSGWRHFLTKIPYIVSTRNANTMPENLLRDPFPVLFEGIHTTSLLEPCRMARKLILVRMHNVEHLYYRLLSRSEPHLLRKAYLRTEAAKLRRYEAILQQADHILSISRPDTDYFGKMYGHTIFVPAFHQFDRVSAGTGFGDYILFHGNLGVPENSEMYLRLHRSVLSELNLPVVVAGKNPPDRMQRIIGKTGHIRLVADPSAHQMDELIRNAHVNLLFTGQATGIKLKLLHALFGGRHCVVNDPMIKGTGLESLCTRAEQPGQLPDLLGRLMKQEFSEMMIRERRKALADYSNRAGAEKILRLLS